MLWVSDVPFNWFYRLCLFSLCNCCINQAVSQFPVNFTSAHRVIMKQCQQTLFLDIGLISPKSFPLFWLPLLLFSPTSFLVFVFYVIIGSANSNLVFVCVCVCVCVSEESLLSVWTEHLHFCSWNYTATGFSCCACLHSYAFEIMLGQKFLKVFLKHLFRNVCRSHMIICVTFHMHKLGSTCVSICWKWNCASPNLIF